MWEVGKTVRMNAVAMVGGEMMVKIGRPVGVSGGSVWGRGIGDEVEAVAG